MPRQYENTKQTSRGQGMGAGMHSSGWADHRQPRRAGSDVSAYRVIKKLSPEKPGAIKLAHRHGDALVCVRHRLDASGQTRVTTIELIVDQAAVQARKRPVPEAEPPSAPVVGVQIAWHEKPLQQAAKGAGATWDAAARLWRMPESVARALELADRIRNGK